MRDGERTATQHSKVETGSRVPLCVDLDGTLLRSDLLVESLLALVRRRPLLCLRLPFWLGRGRARFKQEISERVSVDPATLPYNSKLVAYLRNERAQGRRLFLVTASHELPAQAVADHLALFDGVIATDGRRNLKGRRKRDELVERFGEAGFDYAGDSAADLAVWPEARRAITVNAPARVRRGLGDREQMAIDTSRQPLIRLVLRLIRVRQWVKSLLVFLPMLLAHRYLDPDPLASAALAFLSFSLGASAVYVLNDLMDVEADRHHPRKCRRPFASGELPLAAGFLLIPLLAGSSLAIALFLPRGFLVALIVYFGLTTFYSLVLKELALVDVIVLASLYTLRIIAGSEATAIVVSEWLLAFSMFIFLSLGAVKRYAELLRVRSQSANETKVKGRGYFGGDLELVVQMGLSSGYIAVLVMALYITSSSVATFYPHPTLLWFVCPLLLYWITRIWLLAHRGEVQDDPLSFAVRDWVTWIVALLGAAILFAASRAW